MRSWHTWFALILLSWICVLLVSASGSQSPPNPTDNPPGNDKPQEANPQGQNNNRINIIINSGRTKREGETTGDQQKPSPQYTNPDCKYQAAFYLACPITLNIITVGLLGVYIVIVVTMWHSFFVQERPHIIIGDIIIETNWPDPSNRTVKCHITNSGKSPAWLESIIICAALGPLHALNLQGPPVYGGIPASLYGILRNGGTSAMPYSGPTLLTGAGGNEDSMRAAGQQLFLYGYVSYRDQHSLGKGVIARLHRFALRHTHGSHRTGFIWRFNANNVDRTPCGDRSYWNYS